MKSKTKQFTKALVWTLAGIGISLFAGQKANASPISSFSELLAHDYTTQNVDNYPEYDFTVEGQTPTKQYEFGFLDSKGHVIGYLSSYDGYENYLFGEYNGDLDVPGDENVLGVGEKPYNAIVIEDTNENGVIGDLTSGTLTIDSGDRLWLTADIKFNGNLGAIDEMPAYTGTSDTLVVPSSRLSHFSGGQTA